MAVATGTRMWIRMLGGTVSLAVCSAILNNAAKYGHSRRSILTSSATDEAVFYWNRSMLRNSGLSDDMIHEIILDPTSASTLPITAADETAALQGYSTFSSEWKMHHARERLLLPCAIWGDSEWDSANSVVADAVCRYMFFAIGLCVESAYVSESLHQT
jgi:hypothetical protein